MNFTWTSKPLLPNFKLGVTKTLLLQKRCASIQYAKRSTGCYLSSNDLLAIK